MRMIVDWNKISAKVKVLKGAAKFKAAHKKKCKTPCRLPECPWKAVRDESRTCLEPDDLPCAPTWGLKDHSSSKQVSNLHQVLQLLTVRACFSEILRISEKHLQWKKRFSENP
jgi:hypothetical protein